MGVYVGGDECRVIYVAKNGQQLRVSSVWVGDQQVFPPADRQEVHLFTRATQDYGRVDNGTHFAFSVPVPWWATSLDVVILGAGEKGRDGTKSFTGGSDGNGGRSGAWVVKTIALTQSTDAVVNVGKGTSTAPHATEMILPGVGGQADVRVHDGEGTRTANSGSTGGTPSPRSRTEYGQTHTGGYGGGRDGLGTHPGGGGGGGKGANLIGNPSAGRDGGDGYVWLRFRSAPALNPGEDGFILRVGVTSGYAYNPLRTWAVGLGKTHKTITEITVPMEVIGPSLHALFRDCSSLTSIPEFDTSQVTDTQDMFYNCSSLASVPELNTSNVTNMLQMFVGCSSLATIPALDTSNVTNMRNMFHSCSSLATIQSLDTSQVTTMHAMFYGCSSLTIIPALDTGQVTTMRSIFNGCSSLTTVPELNTSNVTNPDYMFTECSSLESVTLPGMGNGFTAKQTLDMRDTKLSAAAANALMQSLGTPAPGGTLQLPATAAGANTSIATAKNWQVTVDGESSVPDPVDVLLVGVTSGNAYAPLREWAMGIGKTYQTITEITVPMEVVGPSLQRLFSGCEALTSVPALDTSQVTDMRWMFFECSSLESVTLPGMGNGFTAKQTLDMRDTKLSAAAANALMQSLGTPAPGGTLQLPATAAGANTSIATAKNWTVTIG